MKVGQCFSYSLFMFIVVVGWSCQSPADSTAELQSVNTFFDLVSFFDQEISQLNQQQPKLKKTVIVNGAIEEQELNSVDYQKELSLFKEININKPALINKYSTDSSLVGTQLQQLTYQALDESLNIKRIAIFFQDDRVQRVDVEKSTTNMFAKTGQQLTYEIQKGYQINSEQDLVVGTPSTISVKVDFL